MSWTTRRLMGPLAVLLIDAFAQSLLGCSPSPEEDLRNALQANPNDIDTRVSLARELMDQEARTEAIFILREGLLLEPDNKALLRALGFFYLDWAWKIDGERKYEMASEYLETLVEAGGGDGEVYRKLGYVRRNLGREEEAVEAYGIALALLPGDGNIEGELGFTYKELENMRSLFPGSSWPRSMRRIIIRTGSGSGTRNG